MRRKRRRPPADDTQEKPVRIQLDFDDAVDGLLRVKPKKVSEKKRKKKSEKPVSGEPD